MKTRLIAVGWGEGATGAVLEIPFDSTDEDIEKAYQAVEVDPWSKYKERFHIAITQLAEKLGGKVITEEWHHLGF